LCHDSHIMTLTDSSRVFDARVESTSLNTLDEENEYVVEMIWKGQHTGNMT